MLWITLSSISIFCSENEEFSTTIILTPILLHLSLPPTAYEEIDSMLLYMHDKSSKKLHSEKYREKTAAKLALDSSNNNGKCDALVCSCEIADFTATCTIFAWLGCILSLNLIFHSYHIDINRQEAAEQGVQALRFRGSLLCDQHPQRQQRRRHGWHAQQRALRDGAERDAARRTGKVSDVVV